MDTRRSAMFDLICRAGEYELLVGTLEEGASAPYVLRVIEER